MAEDSISVAESEAFFGNNYSVGENKLTLEFNNVSYSCKKSKSETIQILEDVSGRLQAGRLAAILGPSGAGKTSLLNVLSGFKASGVIGHFSLNEHKRNLQAFRKLSSYIPQDFAMLDLLTVQETLQVSADLKLPGDKSSKEKQQIITNILRILNMEQCRSTLTRDLSGGERKRLSIGVELVSNPPIMFFDEPTSGLDSVASLQLMNYLRLLAQDGRIIVCVVHQPSSRLMQLFDDVLVMSHGRMLYAGSQRDLLETFEKAGFKCPNYYNPADFVLEVSSEKHDNRTLSLIEQNQSRFSREVERNQQITSKVETTIDLSPIGKAVQIVQLKDQIQHVIRPKEHVTFRRQFSVLFCRSLKSMSRNLIPVQLRVVMHIVVGILLGVVFWNIGDDASKTLTNTSCILFIVLFVFFGNSMPSILLCPQDTVVFLREYLNSWYSIRAYYAAKIFADLPMQFLCPTLFIALVCFMTGQPMEPVRLLMCWGICFLTAVVGHFFGLVFGSTFDLQMSVFLVPGIAIPFLIFSGYFIHVHELSLAFRPFYEISFFRYTVEGFMQAIYGYDRADLTCNVDFCYYKQPSKILKDFGMSGDNFGRDIIGLVVIIFILKILFYLSLVYRIKRAQ